MLLRSITKHVKDQNWIAIGIDFLVVVLGILIAFQVTNWNEVRQERRAEGALVKQLADEFRTLEGILEQRLARAEGLIASTSELIVMVRDGDEPPNTPSIKDMLQNATRFSAPVAQPTAFSDGLQSGRISSLRNGDLREALNAYVISTDWWSTVEGPSDPQVNPDSMLSKGITWEAKKRLDEALRRDVLEFDWARIVEAEFELVAIHRKQVLQAEAYRLEIIEVRKVQRELSLSAQYPEGQR